MYVVFNQTIHKNRCNGARGGRAFARNQRLRKLLAAQSPSSDQYSTLRTLTALFPISQ